MPFVRQVTTCSLELRESNERGALFVKSRHHRRTSTFMVVFQGLMLGGFVVLWIQHRMRWVGNVICGAGVALSLAFVLALLWLRLTRWELRTDREKQRVTFREKRPFGPWVERWTLVASEAGEVVFSHPGNWAVEIVLGDGRRLVVDQGLQEEELGRLAGSLAEALGRPIRRP